MPRLVIDPVKQDQITTSELYNDDITDRRITFGADGVSEQDLDDDVVDAFADEYDHLLHEDDVDETELDELGEMLGGTVDDVRDAIATGEYDDQLDELEQRESRGADRQTVHEAVERRRDAIEQAGDETEPEGEGGEGEGE